jgi:hypothetical protein
MQPRERRETGEQDLFRSRLDQIIDMKHPLVALGRTLDWGFHVFNRLFGIVFADGFAERADVKPAPGTLSFQFTISRCESSRPSQPVRNSEKMFLLPAEKPANGGLLRIRHQSPGSGLRHFPTKIAGSLRRTFEKLPFLGDGGRRLGSICTARPSLQ